MKINKDKTQIMKLGSTSQGNVDMNNVTKLGKMVPFVKVLGVYFSLDIDAQEEMNYKEILSTIKRLLGWWNNVI